MINYIHDIEDRNQHKLIAFRFMLYWSQGPDPLTVGCSFLCYKPFFYSSILFQPCAFMQHKFVQFLLFFYSDDLAQVYRFQHTACMWCLQASFELAFCIRLIMDSFGIQSAVDLCTSLGLEGCRRSKTDRDIKTRKARDKK